MKDFLNKIMIKQYLLYFLIILFSIFVIELIVPTKWAGFIFSLFSAYWNFLKIVAITIVVDKLKKILKKRKFKGRIKLLFEFVIKFPVPIYSIYLLWYVVLAIGISLVANNDMTANIALQNAISMVVGILIGIVAFLQQDKTKKIGLSQYRESCFFTCKSLSNC